MAEIRWPLMAPFPPPPPTPTHSNVPSRRSQPIIGTPVANKLLKMAILVLKKMSDLRSNVVSHLSTPPHLIIMTPPLER